MAGITRLYEFADNVSIRLDKLVRVAATTAFLVMILVFLIQIGGRYLFSYSFPWALEFIRFTYMYALFFGITVAFRSGEHILFEALLNIVSDKFKRLSVIVAHVFCLAFFIFLFVYGIKLFKFTSLYTMMGFPISRSWKVLPVSISGFVLLVHLIPLLIGDIIGLKCDRSFGLAFFGSGKGAYKPSVNDSFVN